eukprot:7687265-Prorocentrum_lima.AAC.1
MIDYASDDTVVKGVPGKQDRMHAVLGDDEMDDGDDEEAAYILGNMQSRRCRRRMETRSLRTTTA